MKTGWEFVDGQGSFRMVSPQDSSYLYFPLANEAGMMSSITPTLHGDAKAGQNAFLLPPVSAVDLHDRKSGRNFWLYIHGRGAWSAAGASAKQEAERLSGEIRDAAELRAGFLWHSVARENARLGVRAEVTSFVPAGCDRVELMRVSVTNTGSETLRFTPTAAIPVYGRSADNVRDHRHVTSLLARAFVTEQGVDVQPAMTFDERGHKLNALCYCVCGTDDSGHGPAGSFPCLDSFIGEGGSLAWPEAVAVNSDRYSRAGEMAEGCEMIGALRFTDVALEPGRSKSYFLALAITDGRPAPGAFSRYLNPEGFEKSLDETKAYWEGKLGGVRFETGDRTFDLWMKWVALQSVLRRIYGCSFLPHHDYGRGGRGWRDLWQDCLALLSIEPETARTMLLNNFGGVRLDGTNATIIGATPGEFIADRNSIARVWSDHGAWPCFTTLLYIDATGDFDFLLERQTYFKDRLAMRSREVDERWTPAYGNRQKTENCELYTGTILEHLLIQNLTAYCNAGDNGNIRIENADWNDALDMACERGETVAFTSFYAGNLAEIARLLREMKRLRGVEQLELCEELLPLLGLDTVAYPDDCGSPEARREALRIYCLSCAHDVSGRKALVNAEALAAGLERKARRLAEHIRKNERVRSHEGAEWFNGYYDGRGERVEGETPGGVRMTLTGQVFALMMGIATDAQAKKAAAVCERYLRDGALGGWRLNTDFSEVKLDFGRCFGFAYGHKENGAVFSHMAVMYACALYRRGLAKEAWEVVKSLYMLSVDFERARIYPGIPEYFDNNGRGMYHYLTGSASWLVHVLLREAFGVKGRRGDLILAPKLMPEQFGADGRAAVRTTFAGRKLRVACRNVRRLEWGAYRIGGVTLDGRPVEFARGGDEAVICREVLLALGADAVHDIEVTLI